MNAGDKRSTYTIYKIFVLFKYTEIRNVMQNILIKDTCYKKIIYFLISYYQITFVIWYNFCKNIFFITFFF